MVRDEDYRWRPWRLWRQTTTIQNVELYNQVPIDTSTKKKIPHPRLRKHSKRGNEKVVKPEDEGIFYKIVSLSNVRSYWHKVSTTWPPKHELKMTTDMPELTWQKPIKPQPRTKSYRQLGNTENSRTHQLVMLSCMCLCV